MIRIYRKDVFFTLISLDPAKSLAVTVTTAIAIYFLIWWITLFAVLPFDVRRQDEDGAIAPGTDPGAPAVTRLGIKLLWTTVVASAIFAACYVVYVNGLLPLDTLEKWLRLSP